MSTPRNDAPDAQPGPARYISHDDGKAILQPRMPQICVALRRTMAEWNGDMAKYHALTDAFLRSLFINQLWYHHTRELLRLDPGIEMFRYSNGRFFTVDDTLDLRIKLAYPGYRPWDHPTPRAEARSRQLAFPTLPPLVHLNFCYRLDISGTLVQDAMVIMTSGREHLWRWQVWGRPISEYAAMPRNFLGQTVYSHDDYSEVTL